MAIDTIKSVAIFDGSVATADIADDAVTSAKLDTNIAVAGTLGVTGAMTGTTQTLNRSGDGDLLAFQKGGADSGSISIESSGTAFDGEASHAGLKMFLGGIGLRQNGADVDNTIDLGWTGGRVKDIYIGGGIYLGGTGAANKLDDYEEGTWTPALTHGGSGTFSLNSTFSGGKYVKIGNVVHLYCKLRINVNNSANGTVTITGLPFTSATEGAQGAFHMPGIMYIGPRPASSDGVIVMNNSNATTAAIWKQQGLSTDVANILADDGEYMYFGISYRID